MFARTASSLTPSWKLNCLSALSSFKNRPSQLFTPFQTPLVVKEIN